MAKLTIELPDELNRQVEFAALDDQRTAEEIIRAAIEEAMRKRVQPKPRPKPRLPLTDRPLGAPDIAERLDEYMKGFGED